MGVKCTFVYMRVLIIFYHNFRDGFIRRFVEGIEKPQFKIFKRNWGKICCNNAAITSPPILDLLARPLRLCFCLPANTDEISMLRKFADGVILREKTVILRDL